MGRVQDKIAFLSGGASGIGRAAARVLAREGAFVYLADINGKLASTVLREIEEEGGRGTVLDLDVTLEDSWVAAMERVRSDHGGLNILLNSAGIAVEPQFPADMNIETWRKVMSVNLDGIFLGTKHGLKLMQESQPVNGSIINMSSVLGITGAAGVAPYVASKGAVRLFTKSVALSCAERALAIRANSLHPGYIHTPLVEAAAKERFASEEEGMNFFQALAPVGRLGTAEEVANAILFLASDEASYMTGSELVIDGGFTAR